MNPFKKPRPFPDGPPGPLVNRGFIFEPYDPTHVLKRVLN